MSEKPDKIYIKIVEFSLEKIGAYFEHEHLVHDEFNVFIDDDFDKESFVNHFKDINVKFYKYEEGKKIFSRTSEPNGLSIRIFKIKLLRKNEWVYVKFNSSLKNMDGTLKFKFSSLREPYTISEDFHFYVWYAGEEE